MDWPKFGSVVLSLIVIVSLSGCENRQKTDPVSEFANTFQSLDPVKKLQLDNRLEKILEWHGITGMALAVLREDQPIFVHYSKYANIDEELPVAEKTLFQLSSTSKIFAGVALMKLVENGAMSLVDPIGNFLTDIPATWRNVKIREVMAHISGLPEILECDTSTEQIARDCLDKRTISNEPNERHRYNQTNAYLVQKLIEKVSGKPLAEAVNSLIFQPAGMTSSVYEGNSNVAVPNRALSYYPDGEGGLMLRIYNFPTFLYSGAGLNSTLSDLMLFSIALQNETILSSASLQTMFIEPRLNDGSISHYALGWSIKLHADGTQSVGHEGGYLTTFRIFPESNLTVIMLANGSRYRLSPDDIALEIAGVFNSALISRSEIMLLDMRDALSDSNID